MRRGMLRRSQTKFVEFNKNNCKACWKCVEACPENIFGKINILIHKHARIVNSSDCTGCMKCVKACDFGAIYSLGENK